MIGKVKATLLASSLTVSAAGGGLLLTDQNENIKSKGTYTEKLDGYFTRSAASAIIGAASKANRCGVDWKDVYAIRHMESGFSMGHELADGTAMDTRNNSDLIAGGELDGSGGQFSYITDSGAEIDRLPGAERAVGPYQFLPNTARNVAKEPLVIEAVQTLTGRPPNPVIDVTNAPIQSIYTVALLCDNGYNSTYANRWKAIMSHNGSGPYAQAYANEAMEFVQTLPPIPDPMVFFQLAAFDASKIGTHNLILSNASTNTQQNNQGPALNLANNVVGGSVDAVHWIGDRVDRLDDPITQENWDKFERWVDNLVAPPSNNTSTAMQLPGDVTSNGIQPIPISTSSKTYSFPLENISILPVEIINKPHHGYAAADLPIDSGLKVLAMIPGQVHISMDSSCGQGLVIVRADGWRTIYCHLSKTLVADGQHVAPGTPVALSGGASGEYGAGHSTGPHLHVGLKNPAGTNVCPQQWLVAVVQEQTPPDFSQLSTSGCSYASV